MNIPHHVLAQLCGYRSDPPVIDGGPDVSINPRRRIGHNVESQSFVVAGQRYKRVRFARGRWEVYRIDPDGLETFIGHERYLVRLAGCWRPE